MSILKILQYPDCFLKKKASSVSKIDTDTKKLISDMTATMYFARGIGLAATQVGVDKRIAVLDVPSGDDYQMGTNLIVMINPEIAECESEITHEEGCLSIPGFTATIKRFENITVECLDKEGKNVQICAKGLFAIALQHEIDHLNGMLFIDRLSKLKRDILNRKIKKTTEA